MWPDREAWKRAFYAKMVCDDPETHRRFAEAIAEAPPNGEPTFLMEIPDVLLTDQAGVPPRLGALEEVVGKVAA